MFLRALLSVSTTAATKIETKRASCNQQENKKDFFSGWASASLLGPAFCCCLALRTLSDFLNYWTHPSKLLFLKMLQILKSKLM